MERLSKVFLSAAAALTLGTCVPRPPEYMLGIESACEPGAEPEVTRQRVLYAARLAAERTYIYDPFPLLDSCPPEALRDGIDSIQQSWRGVDSDEEWRMVGVLARKEESARRR